MQDGFDDIVAGRSNLVLSHDAVGVEAAHALSIDWPAGTYVRMLAIHANLAATAAYTKARATRGSALRSWRAENDAQLAVPPGGAANTGPKPRRRHARRRTQLRRIPALSCAMPHPMHPCYEGLARS